jgi:hypothetical protein
MVVGLLRPVRRFARVGVALFSLMLLGASLAACGTADAGAGVVTEQVTPYGSSASGSQPAGSASPVTSPGAGASETPPAEPELMLSTLSVYQSGAVLVSVTGAVTSGNVTFLGRQYPLTKGTKSMFTFAGVDTEDPTGPAAIKVDFLTPNGSKGTLSDTVTVLHTPWTVDSLQFSDETSQLLDPKIVNDELALLHSIYTKVTPEKYWSGDWLLPVDGPLTARYGEQRSINGSAPSGHHGGTDLAADKGTPVKATNAGRVVLARQLQVRGNMVIIDHGGGLYSGYAHFSAIQVSEGQMVKQGDIIGLSGDTGLVTGPHLHWEMAIDGILLDALRFTDGTNGF